MVRIKPFKAIRPREDLVDKVASLPYDVVSRQEASELTENNPYSYLHVDRSEVDLPDINDIYAAEVYGKAAENLELFLEEGWLKKDETDKFYIYELTFQGRTQTGLVVTASVEDYLNDRIKKHEFTRHDKEIDRINHMNATDANTSPVFLTYRDQSSIDRMLAKWKMTYTPIYNFQGPHATTHRVWIIDDQEVVRSLQNIFADDVPNLYIADGHHRTESAAKIALKRKKEGQLSESGECFLSVLFPISQLRIFDYNRLIKTEAPLDFLEILSVDFNIIKVSRNKRRPHKKHVLALYMNNQWYHLKIKPEVMGDTLIENLDASIAQNFIFDKYFNIHNPREDNRLEFVGGIRGLDVLEERVDNGEANFAVALYPTEKEDLLAVADAGNTMPPKSTWFEPKLLSGLFIRDLESI